MKLFTKEVDKQLFAQYPKGSDLENQMVVAKIFNPYGRGVWYLLNSDPEDPDYIWAIVDLFEPDMGSVSRSELQTVKVPPFGLGLERDIYFSPKPAKEVWEGIMRGERFEDGGSIATQNKDMLENQTANVMHHAKELHEAVKNTDIEIMPWVLTKLQRATTDLQDITHYLEGEEAKFGAGGMTAGRWYKDNSGKEFRYIGESQGKLLFNDGEKIVEKDEDDFEDEPKEKKLFGFFADGGETAAAEHNIKQARYGGKMAKGGGIYSSDSLYYLQVLKDGEEVEKKKFRAKSLKEAKEISEDEYEGDYEKKYGKNLTFIVSEAMAEGGETDKWEVRKLYDEYYPYGLYLNNSLVSGLESNNKKLIDTKKKEIKERLKMAEGGKLVGKQKKLDVNKNGKLDAEDFKMLRKGKMAMGGKVKFEDKVKAIKASLLKRKKVSPKVQKDYGKTYSPKEAEESAKRIVGAQTAKYELKKK